MSLGSLPILISWMVLTQLAAANSAEPENSRTYIAQSLEVAPFVPPAPVVPKRLPVIREDAKVVVPAKFSRTLTIVRGEASTAPDLPVPIIAEPVPPHVFTPEELARLADIRRHTLMLGATVFDRKVSRVHWRHPDSGAAYEADCGFDVGLLAGIGGFVWEGEIYSFALFHSDFNTAWNRKSSKRLPIVRPEIPAGEIVMISGDPADPAGMTAIRAVASILTAERDRLIPYQAARREYQRASAIWHAAHPPEPRDETIVLRPHRGSRYLADPRPESKGATR